MTPRLPDSGAETTPDGRRHAPSGLRNAAPILAELRRVAPARGRVLELAAGSGQHAAEFAAALPGLDWQPTDLDPANLASIAAWRAHAGAPNLRAPQLLDATRPGWAAEWGQQDLILLVNLLHLITVPAALALIREAALALAPAAQLLIYGPFLRQGRTSSPGDAAFHARLRAQDARLGYKDAAWLSGQLQAAGLVVSVTPMPANNLLMIGRAS